MVLVSNIVPSYLNIPSEVEIQNNSFVNVLHGRNRQGAKIVASAVKHQATTRMTDSSVRQK